jgi:hypothetical protein
MDAWDRLAQLSAEDALAVIGIALTAESNFTGTALYVGSGDAKMAVTTLREDALRNGYRISFADGETKKVSVPWEDLGLAVFRLGASPSDVRLRSDVLESKNVVAHESYAPFVTRVRVRTRRISSQGKQVSAIQYELRMSATRDDSDAVVVPVTLVDGKVVDLKFQLRELD